MPSVGRLLTMIIVGNLYTHLSVCRKNSCTLKKLAAIQSKKCVNAYIHVHVYKCRRPLHTSHFARSVPTHFCSQHITKKK